MSSLAPDLFPLAIWKGLYILDPICTRKSRIELELQHREEEFEPRKTKTRSSILFPDLAHHLLSVAS